MRNREQKWVGAAAATEVPPQRLTRRSIVWRAWVDGGVMSSTHSMDNEPSFFSKAAAEVEAAVDAATDEEKGEEMGSVNWDEDICEANMYMPLK